MRIYSQAHDGETYHFRDKNGLEADMIIALNDGRQAAVEVKPGNKQIEEAAGQKNKEKPLFFRFFLVFIGFVWSAKHLCHTRIMNSCPLP